MNKLKISTLALSVLMALLVAGCTGGDQPSSHSEDLKTSRYVQAFADPDNGCEYFTTMDGGMYPRLNKNGSHFGCN